MSDDIGLSWPDMKLPGLAGKTAIVTGTSRGIGCGIAGVLATQGMRLVLSARSIDDGQAFADLLKGRGAECLFVQADLSKAEDARAVLDAALEEFGRVDCLVNNAARLGSKSFLDLDEETYVATFESNMRMLYNMSRPVAAHMAEAGGGSICHISSVGGLRAHRGMAGYDAFKGAMDSLTRVMAVELAPHNIRVNSVAPGATRPYRRDKPLGSLVSDNSEYIPLGRSGHPDESGAAVAFLASASAAYITGQILYLDGGLVVQLSPPGIAV